METRLDVATRWYRAPEVMLSNRRYTTASECDSQTPSGVRLTYNSRRVVNRMHSGRAVGDEADLQGQRVSVSSARPADANLAIAMWIRYGVGLLAVSTDTLQVNLILGVLGTPDDESLARIGSDKASWRECPSEKLTSRIAQARSYVQTLPHCEPVDLVTLFPDAEPPGSPCHIR